MSRKINKTCDFCTKKVNKFDSNSRGFMEINNNLFHYECIATYGYQKFCKEVIEYRSKQRTEEINQTLECACKAIDGAKNYER